MGMTTEHLTPEELLTAYKYCMGEDGYGDTCEGCPNAKPGTADINGMCKCRFNLNREAMRILEMIVGGEKDA